MEPATMELWVKFIYKFYLKLVREGILWSVGNRAVEMECKPPSSTFLDDELCQADLFNQKSNRIIISSVINRIEAIISSKCRRSLDKTIYVPVNDLSVCCVCHCWSDHIWLLATFGRQQVYARDSNSSFIIKKNAVILWILCCVRFYSGITNSIEWHKNGAQLITEMPHSSLDLRKWEEL